MPVSHKTEASLQMDSNKPENGSHHIKRRLDAYIDELNPPAGLSIVSYRNAVLSIQQLAGFVDTRTTGLKMRVVTSHHS